MTGKDITFSAANASVFASEKAVVTGGDYKFAGSVSGESGSGSYQLNAAGSQFEKTAAAVAPFRACFKTVKQQNTAAAGLTLLLEGAVPTGISEVPCVDAEENTGAVYDLQGRRVTHPVKGLYIVNGKKYIK